MAPELPHQEPYPLYNTTFTLHRVSPLYVGQNRLFDDSTLRQHARRLREVLVGDVMRGVRIGLASENDPVSAAGKLNAVQWRLLPAESLWKGLADEEDVTISLEPSRGIQVTIAFEKHTYSAILLQNTNEILTPTAKAQKASDEFQHFPLLLTRMPVSLREVFTNFISETFDARVSNLILTTTHLTTSFEKYLSAVISTEDGVEMDFAQRSTSLRSIIKEAEVHVAFDLPEGSGALKTIEIHLTRDDLPRLISRGKKVELRPKDDTPFLDALTVYAKSHLALNMKHDKVKVIRIACGAFVLGGDGRIKLMQPISLEDLQTRATQSLVDSLVDLATRNGIAERLP